MITITSSSKLIKEDAVLQQNTYRKKNVHKTHADTQADKQKLQLDVKKERK